MLPVMAKLQGEEGRRRKDDCYSPPPPTTRQPFRPEGELIFLIECVISTTIQGTVGSPYGPSLMSSLGQGNKKEGGEVRGKGEKGRGRGEAEIVISKETEGGEGQLGSWLCPLSLRVYTPHLCW
jgi:hypothetical protein